MTGALSHQGSSKRSGGTTSMDHSLATRSAIQPGAGAAARPDLARGDLPGVGGCDRLLELGRLRRDPGSARLSSAGVAVHYQAGCGGGLSLASNALLIVPHDPTAPRAHQVPGQTHLAARAIARRVRAVWRPARGDPGRSRASGLCADQEPRRPLRPHARRHGAALNGTAPARPRTRPTLPAGVSGSERPQAALRWGTARAR